MSVLVQCTLWYVYLVYSEISNLSLKVELFKKKISFRKVVVVPEFSPSEEGRYGAEEGVQPDEDQGHQGADRGRQGELPVLHK